MRNNKLLTLISVVFFAGVITGSAVAMFAAGGGEIADFFGTMVAGARDGELRNSFLRVLIPNLMWPTLVFLLGFCALGVVGIPLCVFSKGFLISYSASAVIRAFGAKGIWLAFASMGIPNLIYVPLMVIVSMVAMKLSAGNIAKEPRGFYMAQFAVISVIFTGVAAYQAYIQPKLITWLVLTTT